MLGITLAMCAGLCASLASVFAKFAMSETTLIACKTVVIFLLELRSETTVSGNDDTNAGDFGSREAACESVRDNVESRSPEGGGHKVRKKMGM